MIAQHAPASEGSISAVVGYLHRGFVWDPPGSPDGRVAVVTYHELVNRFTTRRRAARIASARAMDTFLDFQPGDFVVHADHGIARYAGLVMLKPQEVTAEFQGSAYTRPREAEEYLTLEFAGRTKLHVPVSRIDLEIGRAHV